MINRRHFLELGASLSVAWYSPTSYALGRPQDPRLALLILRGGMDGLAFTFRGVIADPSQLPADKIGNDENPINET